jgi:hypothetical protein
MKTVTKTKTKVVVGVVAAGLAAAAILGLSYSLKKIKRFNTTLRPGTEETRPGYGTPGYETPGYTPPGYRP